MPGLSFSQEMQLEYVTWQPPESLPITMHRRAMDGIHREVSDAFATAPHRGAETGGILLGRREADRIVVEDFEPVPSDHRFGPSYHLSDADRVLLDETIAWFRGGAQPGLDVLGFYRSHTTPEFHLCDEDFDVQEAHFTAEEDLVLLVRPGLMGPNESDFWICRGKRPEPLAVPPPALMSWPAPRPRLDSDTQQLALPSRRWIWYAAAIVLGVVGGALGYLWWHADAGAEPLAIATPAPSLPHPQPAAVPPGTSATGDADAAVPEAPAQDAAGVRLLLDRWVVALKRGDVDAAARCYAPQVSTYFNRHDVSREAVMQSIRKVRAGNGRLEVYKISHLEIRPEGSDKAVAMFHKQWQWAGRRRSAGEEDERMTLVRVDAGWRISAEEAQ